VRVLRFLYALRYKFRRLPSLKGAYRRLDADRGFLASLTDDGRAALTNVAEPEVIGNSRKAEEPRRKLTPA
jgi:hypothetical protein